MYISTISINALCADYYRTRVMNLFFYFKLTLGHTFLFFNLSNKIFTAYNAIMYNIYIYSCIICK